MCGKHALNNLVGKEVFTHDSLLATAYARADFEEAFSGLRPSIYSLARPEGKYAHSVLLEALLPGKNPEGTNLFYTKKNRKGKNLFYTDKKKAQGKLGKMEKKYQDIGGFLVRQKDNKHWVSLRKVHNTWAFHDSLNKQVFVLDSISPQDFFLENLAKGITVFPISEKALTQG